MSKRLELFDKLIGQGSSDPFHFYGRAMELRSLGRNEEALTAFSELIAKNAGYIPSYLMAAQVAQGLGRIDEARDVAQRGIEVAKREGHDHALSELSALLTSL